MGHYPDLGLFPAAPPSPGADVKQQREGGACGPGRDPSHAWAGERLLLRRAAASQGLPTTPVPHLRVSVINSPDVLQITTRWGADKPSASPGALLIQHNRYVSPHSPPAVRGSCLRPQWWGCSLPVSSSMGQADCRSTSQLKAPGTAARFICSPPALGVSGLCSLFTLLEDCGC